MTYVIRQPPNDSRTWLYHLVELKTGLILVVGSMAQCLAALQHRLPDRRHPELEGEYLAHAIKKLW